MLKRGREKDLAESGWGVIFAEEAPPELQEALQPLLTWRRAQAGEAAFQTLRYQPGESKTQFCNRHGKLPHYLLLVGSPAEIPFSFQQQMGIRYALGRLDFEATAAYRAYADALTQATPPDTAPQAQFFSMHHADDPLTARCQQFLTPPLVDKLRRDHPQWGMALHTGQETRRAALRQRLGGSTPPDLLFSSGHGLTLPAEHEQQAALQGAPVCAEWPGPQHQPQPTPDQCLTAAALPHTAKLGGMVGVHYADYSAGTPAYRFDPLQQRPVPVATEPFVSALAKRMLQQGAAAFIGLITPAAGHSFYDEPTKQPILTTLESVFTRLLTGYPVGAALSYMGQHYAELGMAYREARLAGDPPTEVAHLRAKRDELGGWLLLGDPAAVGVKQ